MNVRWLQRVAAALAAVAVQGTVLADPVVTAYSSTANVANLGPTGANLGKLGYWFANFAAPVPTGNQPVDQNDVNFLPSWVAVDFTPSSSTYSFANDVDRLPPQVAYSRGGIAGSSVLTLPGGEVGLSGQLIDTLGVTNNQSDTIIKSWVFGPGAPTSALISIVLDNVPSSALTTVQRLRLTQFNNANADLSSQAEFNNLAAGANGVPDVYSFRLENIEVGGFFAVQLRKAQTPVPGDAGLAGVLFDADPLAVPEVGSFALVALAGGLGGLVVIRRRRATA